MVNIKENLFFLAKLSNWQNVPKNTNTFMHWFLLYETHPFRCCTWNQTNAIRKCQVSKMRKMQNVPSVSIFLYTRNTYINSKRYSFLFLVIIIAFDGMVFKLYCQLGLCLYFFLIYKVNYIFRQNSRRCIRCNY